MRSSIACIRCRRSKVKCVNDGVGTTCQSCKNGGRECTYPTPGVSSGLRQRDSISGRPDVYVAAGGSSGDAERRPRPKKNTHTFSASSGSGIRESPRPALDALDPRMLTPHIWQELFDIFQIHYSADLPFLHPPSFLKPLRYATLQPSPNGPLSHAATARPPASTEFLLTFLALTARFHPRLVAHHSPPTSSRRSNPIIASEYYAAAANERLGNCWADYPAYDIQRTQAMLMLGLHEWGMCRGARAWLIIGTAIRSAQAMGLQYEVDLDDEPLSRSLALDAEESKPSLDPSRRRSILNESTSDVFIQQEVRRRTFWSCYIMDRYLSSGKYRPQMLRASELRIQLPASERSFLFAERVQTLMLGEEDKNISGTGRAEVRNQRQQSFSLGTTGTPEPRATSSPKGVPLRDEEEEKGRLEAGPDEGLVSRYVKILEIYGKVIKWSCSGGRRVDEHPPWDPRSDFNKLLRQCNNFKTSLPRQHTLTPQNTQAHITMKTSTPYALLHTVYLLCQIVLHREYVPFVPIRCSKPEGPLDPPTFPPDRFTVPDGFWENSARDCFRSARELMDLVRTCQEWGTLVETPIVGFAVYTVAFVGVYCISFPKMDPEGFMCTRSGEKPGESKGFDAARMALEMVGNMRSELHMADGWFRTINHIIKYFRRMKSDYRKNAKSVESASDRDSPVSTRHLSLREGGSGGGLDEFKLLERTLQDFGNLEDQDVEMSDATRQDSRPLEAVFDDSNSAATVKSEEASERPGRAPSMSEPQRHDGGAWSAINTGPSTSVSRQPSISTPSSAQFRSYDSYPPRLQPPSLPSSLQPQNYGYSYPTNKIPPGGPNASGSLGGLPSLTSATTHSTAGSPLSHSQPSTPLERQHSHGAWHSHGSAPYPMPAPSLPPPSNPYSSTPSANSLSHPYQHLHQYHHPPSQSTYIAPPQSSFQGASQLPYPPQGIQPHTPMQEAQQQTWDRSTKEVWLDSIPTSLGGDDVAAFTQGGEISEWSLSAAAAQGFEGGWLSRIWAPSQLKPETSASSYPLAS